jgi:pimeloyl-ACP methyl ester carboxylesterase
MEGKLDVRSEANGVGIEFDVTGTGTPVVLLHGFPDSGRLWRNQVPALADAGFQVIVPDLRGYGRSDKPTEVRSYAMPLLAMDVVGILDTLGIGKAHVVGHDWGASLAWVTAMFAPDRVDHLVVMSVGHPGAFHAAGFPQREKSWYMLLFQFEGIAETWLSANGWATFKRWARHPDADAVAAELEATGSLTPGLNWYRANLPPRSFIEPAPDLPAVHSPTMGIWSTGDIALIEAQMVGSAPFVSGPWRYECLEGPGHWMQLEAPDEVNRLLLDFLPAS